MTTLRRMLPPLLLLSLAAPSAIAASDDEDRLPRGAVDTRVETPTLYDDDAGGNASGDDPAIWVHPSDSRRSIVIVTAKEGGLRVYDLRGRQLQKLAATPAPRPDGVPGRFNNVDIARGLMVGGKRTDVAVVSDRYNDQLRFFAINPAGAAATRQLREVTAPGVPFVFQNTRAGVDTEKTAYGLAVWQPTGGPTYVALTQEGTTRIATVRLTGSPNGIGYTDSRHLPLPASFPLPNGATWSVCNEPGTRPQLEGMAVDNARNVLYAAQEDVGLWRIPLPLYSGQPKLIDKVTDFGITDRWDEESEECVPVDPDQPATYAGHLLTADAEGVAIAHAGAGGQIVVSSQGDDRFAVYNLTGANRPLGSFRIRGIDGADNVNGSDGLDVVTVPVAGYPRGLLVSHDEPDSGPGVDPERDPTNFSYVQWGAVVDALALPR